MNNLESSFSRVTQSMGPAVVTWLLGTHCKRHPQLLTPTSPSLPSSFSISAQLPSIKSSILALSTTTNKLNHSSPSTLSSVYSLCTVIMSENNLSSAMATIRGHDGNKIAPILSTRKLLPAVVLEWQSKPQAFFTKQKIPVPNQVSEILDCFKDQQIIGWIMNNQATLTGETYNFTTFMKKFCDLFLNLDWEYDVVHSVLNAKMKFNDHFSSYVDHVITGNNLLWGIVRGQACKSCPTLVLGLVMFLGYIFPT